MKTRVKAVIILASGLLWINNVLGQENTTLPEIGLLRAEEDYSRLAEQESTRLIEQLKYIPLGKRSYLSMGGEARYLAERFHNNGWDEASGNVGWLLQRYVLHTDWHFGNFRTFVQLHSAHQGLTDEAPRGVDVDELDFHQLFVEYNLPLTAGQNLKGRLGRQEFWLGSRRLISMREGPNVRLAFDAARLFYERPGFTVEGMYARLVENEQGVFDNRSTEEEQFWGVYSVTENLVGPFNADLYYLGFYSTLREYDQGQADETRHSIGTRIWKNGAFKVNAEAIYQWGSYGNGDISAYTVSLDISKKTRLPLNPTFGIKSEIVSGDRDPLDEDLQTFNAFYPRGAYFGLIALIGPANLIDVHPSVSVGLTKNVGFTFDWDIFWRHKTADGIYGPNKALERSGEGSNSNYIGHQPGFEIAYEPNRYWSFSLEGSWFIAGDFFEDTGTSENVLHFASSARFRF